MEKDVVFLKDTQSADVGDRVPRRCLLENFPFQSVSYSFSCKSVDIVGETGARQVPLQTSAKKEAVRPAPWYGQQRLFASC